MPTMRRFDHYQRRVMLACRVFGYTPAQWRAMPDSDKDRCFRYLKDRDEQLRAMRERLLEKKAADGAALVGLFVEGL